MQIASFIDNEIYQSSESFTALNPYTLEPQHEVKSCDLMGLVMAIQAANRAFAQWRTSSYDERIQVVEKIYESLKQNADRYALLEAQDQGLPLHFVQKYGIQKSLQTIESTLNIFKSSAASITDANTELPQYAPVGVIAIVAPWNLSLRVTLDRLIPALLAGNAVVVKVSSHSVVTAAILGEILQNAGIVKGLVNVLVSQDKEVKKALLAHPGVRAISVAGNIQTAQSVLASSATFLSQQFKKVQISSGSKNSAVVLAEPTDQIFTEVMESFMLGQGQLVWNSSRLFILEKFESDWEERIRNYLAALRPSESVEDTSVWTPCLKRDSFEKFDEIKQQAHVDKAKLLLTEFMLSEQQKKVFLPPVFTKDMSRCSTLQQDQIHSPFYILSAVKYPFDVAKYSNVSYFGFAAHLWGEPEKLKKVAEALDVGLVTYNRSSFDVVGPVAGVKQSGFGQQDFQSFGDFFSNVKKLSF
ncbi:aldehyde dehydrogenase family protein [Pseudobdellovibrio exovorus]|uniref:2-hydroxymuconic semialdehyde dehydrogenase n=1 Tax=Pseudobdellovibrio exovorus JSS TaxID=1184267 RepID=M4VSX9_9BACT|nr:aldehyde dehydrogenase family protein [Pseudobdellovibrio exovorus]AGH96314.1 2-hydroxymuconic semialdehyde dehydrogenase [Pseudobdellovibrio exovorus JSS]